MDDQTPEERRDDVGPIELPTHFHLDELSEAPRLRVRGWTFILFGLLIVTALLAQQLRPTPTLQHVADQPPAVVAPTGDLAVAYQAARPASLRIEARCAAPAAPQTLGIGTGFFVDSQGTLLTAYHVVDDTGPTRCSTEFFGVDPDGAEYRLSLVGFDAYFDLAVLRAKTDGAVPFIPLARTQPNVGTGVVAIGNSRGDFLEARSGRITRLGVQAGRADFADGTIELTAALAPGDSGGPVLNARGEAVGVVSYISFSPNSLSSDTYIPPFLRGLALPQEFASYAVPISLSSDLVSSVLAGARRDVPVIGFSWQGPDYDPRTSAIDLGPRPGTVVFRVQGGGPAEIAGLRSYNERAVLADDGRRVGTVPEADIIVAIDGEATPGFFELLEVVRRKEIGQEVVLTVQRGNATFEVNLVLGAKRTVFSN
jgi:S1-C subfamily serine protease